MTITAAELAAKMQRKKSYVPPNVHYCCSECEGTGFVYQLSREIDFRGKEVEVKRWSNCSNKTKANLISQSGLHDSEYTKTWKDVRDISNTNVAKEAIIETLERGFGWVYLWGEVGTAKTLMLQIAVSEYQKKLKQARYVTMANMTDKIRLAFDETAQNVAIDREITKWSAIKLLAIDEPDRVKQTEFVKQRVFQIIDNRYRTREQGITLMAANVPPDECDPYFASRIGDGRFEVVHLLGQDMRGVQSYG